MGEPIIRSRRARGHLFVSPIGRAAPRSRKPLRIPPIDRALAQAIDAQRGRLFEAAAILACLGAVLQAVHVPDGEDCAPSLDHVADVLVRMLDSIAAELDPTALRLRMTESHCKPVEAST